MAMQGGVIKSITCRGWSSRQFPLAFRLQCRYLRYPPGEKEKKSNAKEPIGTKLFQAHPLSIGNRVHYGRSYNVD